MAAFEHPEARGFRWPAFFVLLTILAASLFAKPGAAASDAWMVVEASGTATHWSANGRTAPLKAGDSVGAGDSVETGADGHCILKRRSHSDTVTVSPRSRLMIPGAAGSGTAADIVQSIGTLFFNVEHTPGRRFEVDGPYLAAVVKGTSFTVTIAPTESMVDVQQGSVQVQSTGSHQVVLLGPGQFAKVSGFGRHELIGGARQSLVVPPRGGAPVSGAGNKPQSSQHLLQTIGETHLDVGALTNNLVTGAGTRDSASANVSPVSAGALPAYGSISSVGQSSPPQTGQFSAAASSTANASTPSAGTMTAGGGISSVGQSSLPQVGQPSGGGSPTANLSPAITGATATVGGILSVGQSSHPQVGQPSAAGSPTANVSGAATGATAAVGGILSAGQSIVSQPGQTALGGGTVAIKVLSSTPVGTSPPPVAPNAVAPVVPAPANSPVTGLTGAVSSVLGSSLGTLGHK